MLTQFLTNPPHLSISSKYSPDYPSHLLSRPKLVPPSFYTDISHIVESSLSPLNSDSPTNTVDADIPSPNSPPGGTASYHYANRASVSFDSPLPSSELYESTPHSGPYSAPSHSYPSATNTQENYELINSGSVMRRSDASRQYLSNSPSPVDAHPSSSFPHQLDSSHPQERPPQPFPSSYQSGGDHYDESSDTLSDNYSRSDLPGKYSSSNNNSHNLSLDHRRMSEPAVLGSTNVYAASQSSNSGASHRLQQFNFNPPALNPARSSGSAYVPSLQRGISMDSLRDLRNYEYPPHNQYSSWKDGSASHRQSQSDAYHGDDGLDGQISPLQPNFSGGLGSPSALHYPTIAESHYGPSPPGTGTSTSSAPMTSPLQASHPGIDTDQSPRESNKTYSFVALPGNAVKKRPRRRYDEIERLYQCSWPDCNKAYGTLNHLNAHVTMQKHGVKRSPNEFKELRKQWRKAKKDSESPMTGPLRRTSLSQRHDGHDVYSHRRYDSSNNPSPSMYNRHSYHSGGIPTSGERYPAPIDTIRYPIDDRDDQLSGYTAAARQRYSGSTPASWHSGSAPPPRSSMPQHLSSSLPTHSHMQHGHLSVGSQPQPVRSQSPPHISMSRLPPDSTLFTPLPGYQSSLSTPLQLSGDSLGYSQGGFDMYEDDGRPGTGHASLSHGSGDEY